MDVLRERSIHRFHYVLAARRVLALKNKAMRDTALACFETWALSDERSTSLKWALKRGRQLAYHRMHTYMDLGYSFASDTYDRLLDQLRETHVIDFDESASTVESTMDALDRLQSEVIFTSPRAAASVLNHLREFRDWWTLNSELSPLARIERLARRPSDWPQATSVQRTHFCRLKLPIGGLPWTAQVRAWRGSGAIWNGASFLMSPGPQRQQDILVDIYAPGDQLPPSAIAQVVDRLAERTAATWEQSPNEEARRVWKAVAVFGVRALQACVRDGLSVGLTAAAAGEGHKAIAIAARGLEPGCSRLQQLASIVDDPTRKTELSAMAGLLSLASEGKTNFSWLGLLGAVHLISNDTGKRVREIDCAWLQCTPDQVSWYLAEVKTGKQSGGAGHIERLQMDLRTRPSKIQSATIAGARIAFIEIPLLTTALE